MPYLSLDDPMVTIKAIRTNGGLTWNHLCNAAIRHLLRHGAAKDL